MTYLGGSAAALAADRNTWMSRAHTAWGPSRSWGVGTSWEGLYNQSQTDLANMTASRNAWQTNANNAWGPSRVYGSGESWEAAYNRVLPAGSAANPSIYASAVTIPRTDTSWSPCPLSVGAHGPVSSVSNNRINLALNGYYVVYWVTQMYGGQVASSQNGSFRISINGEATPPPQRTYLLGSKYTGGPSSGPAVTFDGVLGAGAFILCQGNNPNDNGMAVEASNIRVVFVPTQTYPH